MYHALSVLLLSDYFSGLGGKCKEKVNLLQLSVSTTKIETVLNLSMYVQTTLKKFIYFKKLSN